MRKVYSVIAAIAVASICTPALAADTLWLDSQHTPYYYGYYSTGQSLTFTAAGVNVRASAWTIRDGKLYQAQLGVWAEGLGVQSGRSDTSHTVDNSGSKDFILFQFDQIVELDKAKFNTGWAGMYDTDATIGYDITDLAYGTLPGWQGGLESQLSVFDLYSSNASGSNGNSYDSYRDINPNDHAGNFWLIGASFNNPSESKGYGHYTQKYLDGFKLEKLTFTQPPPAVPEPATWAMLLVGFFGLGGTMRASRRKQERPDGAEALSAA